MRSLSNIRISRSDEEAIRTAGELLRERFPVERIVLFGSKARGEDDPASDIDLLVLTKRKLTWREHGAVTDVLFDVGLKHDVVFGPLIICEDDWDAGVYQVLPIRDEVDRDGVLT